MRRNKIKMLTKVSCEARYGTNQHLSFELICGLNSIYSVKNETI